MPKIPVSKTRKPTKPTRYCDKIQLQPFYELNDWRLKPISHNTLMALGKDHLTWATSDDKALKDTLYWTKMGIGMSQVREWRKLDPEFDFMCALSLQTIGDRREIGGLTKTFSEAIVGRSMAIYDETWKNLEEWRAKLAYQKQIDNSTKIIVMEKFPTPEEVAAAVTKSTRSEFKTTHEK